VPDALRRSLAGLGVTSVAARFDGCGDSGQIEDLSLSRLP
jgi:hypothetical protein